MKRFSVFALCFLMLLRLGGITMMAQEESFHWYCVHVKDHQQPQIGGDLAFVEELDGYYIDRTHREISDNDKVIYLTFDAGYENGNVARILDVLKEEQVTGAFFILGHMVSENTALVKQMAEEGHTVCNHSVRHKNMSAWSDADFLAELHALEEQYAQATGYRLAPYYRPPEGTFSRQNLVCAKENGYKTVFWSFAYPDWDNQKQMSHEKAKKIILDNVHNGEVMLLHPTSATNAAILGDVIRTLKSEGYRFGSLDELTRAGEAS